MSKKTQTPEPGKQPDARLKRAAEVFPQYPTRDTIYFTADETCFIEAQHAYMHAATLADDTVSPVTRKELE